MTYDFTVQGELGYTYSIPTCYTPLGVGYGILYSHDTSTYSVYNYCSITMYMYMCSAGELFLLAPFSPLHLMLLLCMCKHCLTPFIVTVL